MTGGLKSWLLAVIAACVLCAVAERLMQPGPVKKAGSVTCGLVLIWAVLTPLVHPDLTSGQAWLEEYLDSVEQRETELRDQVNEGTKVLIEQEYAAYIVDKAAEWGISCTARVKCRAGEEGLYLPEETVVTGALSGEERGRLTQMIREDLDVSEERQTYCTEEGAP